MVSRLNAAGDANIELVDYWPETTCASLAFKHTLRTAQPTDFSMLEPLQMWIGLQASGVDSVKSSVCNHVLKEIVFLQMSHYALAYAACFFYLVDEDAMRAKNVFFGLGCNEV